MPKIKTHRGAAKRIKITKNKKLLHRSAWRSHLRAKKKASRKRRYRRTYKLKGKIAKDIKKILPYK